MNYLVTTCDPDKTDPRITTEYLLSFYSEKKTEGDDKNSQINDALAKVQDTSAS